MVETSKRRNVMKNASFSDLEYASKKKTTRKEKFLTQMDDILPWKELLSVIKRHYPKRGNGRPPVALEAMLRIYFMQQWYGFSDPAKRRYKSHQPQSAPG